MVCPEWVTSPNCGSVDLTTVLEVLVPKNFDLITLRFSGKGGGGANVGSSRTDPVVWWEEDDPADDPMEEERWRVPTIP